MTRVLYMAGNVSSLHLPCHPHWFGADRSSIWSSSNPSRQMESCLASTTYRQRQMALVRYRCWSVSPTGSPNEWHLGEAKADNAQIPEKQTISLRANPPNCKRWSHTGISMRRRPGPSWPLKIKSRRDLVRRLVSSGTIGVLERIRACTLWCLSGSGDWGCKDNAEGMNQYAHTCWSS